MEKNINLVYSTKNLPSYNGSINDYQLNGNKFNNIKVMNYNHDSFNEYQNFLYNRALYGLTIFSYEELQMMHWEKKKRISKIHLRTKQVLNIWKQEVTNIIFDKIFRPKLETSKVEFTKEFLELYVKETDPDLENKIPLKTLGITKKSIVSKLIKEGILPKDFNELKPVHYGLPRLLKV